MLKQLDAFNNLVATLRNRVPRTPGTAEAEQAAPSSAATPQSSGPKAGDIEDGYRFKGGNPADPKSWEKQ
jgi:hypothetical protein